MDIQDPIHRVDWKPAALADTPLAFQRIVLLVNPTSKQETCGEYQKQLTNAGYTVLVVKDISQIQCHLTPGTIVVHIPERAEEKNSVYESATESCNTLIAAAQILSKHGSHQVFSVLPTSTGIAQLGYAPLYGLARVLRMEVPDIFGGLFEAEPESFPLDAIKYARDHDVVRVSDGVPHTACLQPSMKEPDGTVTPLQIRPESTYLITGGTKGMGLHIAVWMAKRGARNIILVSRQGLGEGGASDDSNNALTCHVKDLQSQGANVHVLGIDLGLPGAEKSLRQAIAGLGLPPIKGVVHAAGVAQYKMMDGYAPSDLDYTMAPKAAGALALDSIFAPGELDFFLLTSSVGQLVGFPGQLTYAPANSFLDGFASYRRQQGDACTSIQWTSWRGVGMVAQTKSATRIIDRGMQARGIAWISPDEALATLDRIGQLATDHVAVVRALPLDADEPVRHPILQDITPRKSVQKHQWEYPADAVAIVGLACRTAAGGTADDLWDAIRTGQSKVRELDAKRFPEVAARKGPKLWGNFLSDPESFDHGFFGKSRREAAALDPHQRVLLETTYHALESAGWLAQEQTPETHDGPGRRDTTGCFIGMNAPDYPLNLGSHAPSPYTGVGMMRSFVAGRLSHHFGWTGPSHVIDTACSSAMVAIHQACRALQAGDCTRAVAGGINLFTNTVFFDALRAGGFLSETGPCKTFDARADGYCRGEAVGVLVLKPLSRALQDGDEISGVLLSTGENQNINKTSITNPVMESQRALYHDLLARGGISSHQISYVEAHGTGTRAGDPVEMEGIRQALGGPERETLLHIGGVKPNIGHSEGASGVISLIKVLLMMKHRQIAPQANFERLNPHIAALGPDRMAIPTSTLEWNNLRGPLMALVNNFGASGSNAAALVASPPPPAPLAASLPSPTCVRSKSLSKWPVWISAASENSLSAYCQKLRKLIRHSEFRPEFSVDLGFALATKQSRQLSHAFTTTVTSLVQSLHGPRLFPAILDGIDSSADLVLRHAALFAIQYSVVCVPLTTETRMVLSEKTGRASIIKKYWGPDPGAMIAIETDLVGTQTTPSQHLEPFRQKHPECTFDIACYNGPNQYVVAGRTSAMELLETALTEEKRRGANLRFTMLRDMHAYHSAMADSITDEGARLSATISLQTPRYPFESCHKGPWTSSGTNFVARNTRGPVYFGEAIERIVSRLGGGPCIFLEAGLGSPIVAMARNALSPSLTAVKHQSPHTFIAIDRRDPVSGLAEAVTTLWRNGHLSVQFWPFHPQQRASYRPISLPQYQFEKHPHWLEFIPSQSKDRNLDHQHSGTCPHCGMETNDYPYITLERSQPGPDGQAVFRIDPRSSRFQKLVKGHVVVGTPISPAPMYLELIAHAVFQSEWHTHAAPLANLKGNIWIQDLEIMAPLGPDPQRSVFLTLNVKGSGAYKFEISSTITSGKSMLPSRHIYHATGIVSLKEEDAAGVLSGPSDAWARSTHLLERESVDELRGPVVYKVFSRMVKYSAMYRGLKRIVGKGDEVSGVISMPPLDPDYERSRSFNTNNITNPQIMDNFMQVPGAFVHSLRVSDNPDDEDSDMSYICTGMGSVGPLTNLPCSESYQVYAKIQREDQKEVILDVVAFDANLARVVWSAQGLKFARVTRRSLAKVLAAAKPSVQEPREELQSNPTAKQTSSEPTGFVSSSSSVPPVAPPDSDGVLDGVQKVVSRCLDVPRHDVSRHATLRELGTDSLVSIEIQASLRDQFGVDISADEFADKTTVGDLCDLVRTRLGGGVDADECGISMQISDPSWTVPFEANAEWQETVLAILCQSLEIPISDIQRHSGLNDLGVDSLLTPEIIDHIKDSLNVELSSADFAALSDVESLFDLLADALGVDAKSTPTTASSETSDAVASPSDQAMSTTTIFHDPPNPWEKQQQQQQQPFKAPSTLLHRGPTTAATGQRNLFLMPGGFGSGAVFTALAPYLARVLDISAYAFSSPFLSVVTTDYRSDIGYLPSVEELAGIYLKEIKKRQPTGPYLLGGYSMGGVVAFEATRQLVEAGEVVERLVLLDSASPTRVHSQPDALVQFLDAICATGRPNNNGRPQGTIASSPHSILSRAMLRQYRTRPLRGLQRGIIQDVVLFSARDGIDKQGIIPRPKVGSEEQSVVDWFLDDRTDDGPLGWEDLLDIVRVFRAEGNHYSVMEASNVS
ncbi:hypothetical protein ASPBRDRAFT_31942 [Aspergillus brasiliensis CBS 101740]|uniref:Carrier domain-containing protein n=1 Tax=Aspergillus brasiliensis (strain CBS 101740 / IMI 381727 / IBT 21946) TaxID=767769 RepID=A0A1L9UEH5_ASPBC|nr:hypothetical protein ASPBRDRAFT_31942 [Aspergillus brasiliensis CBS 101740]